MSMQQGWTRLPVPSIQPRERPDMAGLTLAAHPVGDRTPALYPVEHVGADGRYSRVELQRDGSAAIARRSSTVGSRAAASAKVSFLPRKPVALAKHHLRISCRHIRGGMLAPEPAPRDLARPLHRRMIVVPRHGLVPVVVPPTLVAMDHPYGGRKRSGYLLTSMVAPCVVQRDCRAPTPSFVGRCSLEAPQNLRQPTVATFNPQASEHRHLGTKAASSFTDPGVVPAVRRAMY